MELSLSSNVICILILCFFLTGCKKDNKKPASANVYIAGYDGDTALYWTNSVALKLSDGSNPAVAHSIFVSGTDVYLAGEEQQGSHDYAVYWKNGIANYLPYTSASAESAAFSILVSANNVFVAGFSFVNPYTAAVWKNGLIDTLPQEPVLGIISSMCVSDGNVYLAGVDTVAGYQTATYWKNGTPVHLSNAVRSIANSIVVSGTDVYVAGYYITSGSVPAIPCYWKNGVLVNLSKNWGMANSIFVSGNDVYVTGVDTPDGNKYATVWKNGSPIYLSTGSNQSIGNSIFVLNNDVYVAGILQDPITDAPTAAYWKNGTQTILGPVGSYASSIYAQ